MSLVFISFRTVGATVEFGLLVIYLFPVVSLKWYFIT